MVGDIWGRFIWEGMDDLFGCKEYIYSIEK